MTSPSRTPEARRDQYLRSRKQRKCKQCDNLIDLGSRKLLCDPCREAPNPRCKKCKKVKPLSRFSRDATRPSGYFPWCMDCQNSGTKSAAWQNPNDELNGHTCPLCDTPIRGHRNRRFCSNSCKDRVSSLRSKFGLDVADYRRLVDATAGRCPLCQNRVTQWHVDHNHKTGKVTGVVCAACNVGALAYTYHDPGYAARVALYLSETPADRMGIVAVAPEGATQPSKIHKVWGNSRRRGRR